METDRRRILLGQRSLGEFDVRERPRDDMPIDVSSVAVISPGDGKATKVGYRHDPDGTKVRICKRTGVDLP